MKPWVGLVGAVLVIGGAAAIYWPAALILAGVFFIRAYIKLEMSEKNAGKPQ